MLWWAWKPNGPDTAARRTPLRGLERMAWPPVAPGAVGSLARTTTNVLIPMNFVGVSTCVLGKLRRNLQARGRCNAMLKRHKTSRRP